MGIEQKENWSNEYLSSFKVASYVTKEEEEVIILIIRYNNTEASLLVLDY